MNTDMPSHSAVSSLLDRVGITGTFEIEPIKGSYNNRVFLIKSGSRNYCLKSYFKDTDDTRNRLETEFKFLSFAWKIGIRCQPQPFAVDHKNNLGLYEYIPGRKLEPDEINEGKVQEALRFFRALNNKKYDPMAEKLPNGSEACFSLRDHLITVENRLERLNLIKISSQTDKEAIWFVQNDLANMFYKIENFVIKCAMEAGIDVDGQIKRTGRCLSPSDFGFHNAILTEDRRLHFIDFEYAGWDDPAKMVCDFFCQPAVPVPLKYFTSFAQEVAVDLPDPDMQVKRFNLLFPLCQIKWCFIMLNTFLLSEAKRYRFANKSVDMEKQKKRQLEKAKKALKQIRIIEEVVFT